MSDTQEPRDPVTKYPQPDFPQQEQSHPGRSGPMDPPPDHGEESYKGHGLLTDITAEIVNATGGTPLP
ncbi:putative oxidoreductase YghA [Streptomyces sp. S4.7]|nr:putative oxidoreductase YghA [Streptomyces sp. S4.7]